MDIGKKIKELRLQKFMTQSELAGNEITRNMLSRIENGAAQPSLDTLKYLASRPETLPERFSASFHKIRHRETGGDAV